MKRVILGFSLLLTCLFPESVSAQAQKPFTRTLSLTVLQEKLKECMSSVNCPDSLLKLCGLTRIEGYVLDEANNDLLVFGQGDPKSPPLYTENFVVALRNAWLKYVELKGNTRYYSDPGCSIDPDPNLMRQLAEIRNKVFSHSTSGGAEDELERWHAICGQPQTVSVQGIPFNTRFARIMVDADYYAKRLVDGSVSLDIDGFTSLTDMTLDSLKRDILSNKPTSVSASFMNRFEFYPGENKYKYDEGIVLIDKCPVVIQTEEQYLTRSNKIAGTGKPDRLAETFAQAFSVRYSEIARQRPIYSELEGLFRFVALAKIMKYNGVEKEINLDYLLDLAHVLRVSVDSTVPGISHVKEFQHRWDYADSYETLDLWLPSCGGVTIRIDVAPEDFVKGRKGELAKLRESIVKLRPSRDALFWDVP